MNASTSSTSVLPVEQYVAGLNRKRMAAGVLFRDRHGRLLLLEPSYKPNWEIPGGAVEPDEAPWETARREPLEETGLDRPLGRMLVIDYVRPQDSRAEGVVFVFDGGVLDETDLIGMAFEDGEILAAALEAVEHGVTALCEQGIRIA